MAKRRRGLFEAASSKVQRAARREFGRTPLGRLTREAARIHGKPRSAGRKFERVAKNLPGMEMMREMEQGGGVVKYAADSIGDTLKSAALNQLWSALGPLGPLIRSVVGTQHKTARQLENQVDSAINFLNAMGYEVMPPKGRPGQRRGKAAASRVRKRAVEPKPVESEYVGTEYFDEDSGQWVQAEPQVRQIFRPSGLPEDDQPHMIWRSVTGSSNVHSYGYDYNTATMYVRYLAAATRGSSIKGGESMFAKGKTPRAKKGRTVTQYRKGAGSLYAYYKVPSSVFEAMDYASSKGSAVWSLLRDRGSRWSHKFKYDMVGVGMRLNMTDEGRITGGISYVPRKALKSGFRKRTVMHASGRKYRSILPGERFGKGKGGQPNRATPNRAAPNRG